MIEVHGTLPWRRAAATLRAKALEFGATAAACQASVVRIEQTVEDVDLLAWLAAQRADERLFWADRDNTLALAGVGIALVIDGEDFECTQQLCRGGSGAGEPDLRYVLTARFGGARTGSEWNAFGTVRVYLPRIEVRHTSGRTTLACHLRGDAADLQAEIAQCTAALAALRDATPLVPRQPLRGSPQQMEASWASGVAELLASIQRAELQKAVLARHEPRLAAEPLCPIGVLEALSAAHPNTFRFGIQLGPESTFVGASPELLFRRRGAEVKSEAIAGTRPRGASPAADATLAAELLASRKEQLEHSFVCDHIRRELGPLCREFDSEPADVVRLANVQHLRTRFRGTLRDGTGDAQTLACLHPTPAVCGLPAARALDHITACEAFDRGLYGGPIGCLGPDGVDFAVAIRCGLVRGNELRLYAGAGIVEGSDAEVEWLETVSKMRAFAPLMEQTQ